MSFNEILLVSVVILAFFIPIIMVASFILGAEIYRKGLNAGKTIEKGGVAEKVTPKIIKKAPKPDPKLERYEAISRNIDIFDGTSIGQEKING